MVNLRNHPAFTKETTMTNTTETTTPTTTQPDAEDVALAYFREELNSRGKTPVEQLNLAKKIIAMQDAMIARKDKALQKWDAMAAEVPTAPTATTKGTPAPAAAATVVIPKAGTFATQEAALAAYNAIDPNDAQARADFRERHADALGLNRR